MASTNKLSRQSGGGGGGGGGQIGLSFCLLLLLFLVISWLSIEQHLARIDPLESLFFWDVLGCYGMLGDPEGSFARLGILGDGSDWLRAAE